MVRCELDGVMKYKGQEQLLLVKALNEFDSKSSGTSLAHILPRVSTLFHLSKARNGSLVACKAGTKYTYPCCMSSMS